MPTRSFVPSTDGKAPRPANGAHGIARPRSPPWHIDFHANLLYSHQLKEFNMEIKRSGSQPSGKGPAEYFTGTVRIDPLIQADAPTRIFAASVTFEPGARTAWHTHPLDQALIVPVGCGLVQRWGGPLGVIRPGDVV